MKARGLLALVLALSVHAVSAFGYEDALDQGTVIPGISARSLLMGGAMAIGYGDPTSVLLNPANLGRVSAPGIEFNVGPGIATENIEDSLGRHSRSYIGLGPISIAARIPAGRSLTFGAGMARVTDYSYDGLHYLAEDPLMPGFITGEERFNSSGGLWEAVAGGSFRVARWLTLGLSAGPRFGSADLEYEFIDRVGEEDSTESWSVDENALCIHAGATLPLGLNSFSVAWISGSDDYPSRVAAGAIFHSGGTAEGFSVGLEGEVRSPGDSSTVIGRVSTRFTPNPGFIFGAGLSFADRGSGSGSSNLGLSLGVSISLGKAVLNGSFAFLNSKRDETAFGFEGFDEVEDRIGYFGLGLDWTL